MRSSPAKFTPHLLILCLGLLMFGCAPAKPTLNPNLIWTVSLAKFEVKNKLQGIRTVAQYNGSYDEVIQQSPADGNVYLILKLTVSKQGKDPASFDWTQLTVQDTAGNIYHRIGNDTFLEQYKYTPRMTGLAIKFGENEGWLCYEIPVKAADGKLTLSYNVEGSRQEIVVKK